MLMEGVRGQVRKNRKTRRRIMDSIISNNREVINDLWYRVRVIDVRWMGIKNRFKGSKT